MAEEGSPAVGSPLAGKTALVTGGGTGIGRAFAQALSDHGAEVVICGRRPGPLETVAAELRSLGRAVTTVRCDLTVEDDLRSLVEAAGPVDILVNNAGYGLQAPWTEVSLGEWREVMAVNVEAPLRLAQLLVPAMIERHWGRVVNISSVYGIVVGNPYFYDFDWDAASYVTSKHALIGLSKYLAVRTGGTGVTVNTLSPGMFPYTEANIDLVTAEGLEKTSSFTPMKRVGDVRDLRSALLFLVSPESSFVTGQNIVVDGGWTIW
jgi:NAD(P)-dependent dehydrogenase (short-subunit alcohol dehydrogenase family)